MKPTMFLACVAIVGLWLCVWPLACRSAVADADGDQGGDLPKGDPLLEAIQKRFGKPDRVTGSGRVFIHYNLNNGDTLTLVVSGAKVLGIEHKTKTSMIEGSKPGDEREIAGVRFCWCPPGKFMMGSPPGEPERRPGEDQVEVTLTKGFWMAKYEATQGQWKRAMGKLPGELTAELPEGDDYPVGNVNFAEIEAYCRKLTDLGRQSGELPNDWEVRLPTEAQWEYSCRAGSFGDKLSSKQANFKGKPYNGAEPGPSLGRAAKVGSYPANPWGLHDMHGNIYEWCRDWAHARLPGGVDPDLYDAKATAQMNRTGDYSRIRRGGAWTDDGWPCRSAFRVRFEPHRRYDHIGFRVAVVRLK